VLDLNPAHAQLDQRDFDIDHHIFLQGHVGGFRKKPTAESFRRRKFKGKLPGFDADRVTDEFFVFIDSGFFDAAIAWARPLARKSCVNASGELLPKSFPLSKSDRKTSSSAVGGSAPL
jgi:hypothetical protein